MSHANTEPQTSDPGDEKRKELNAWVQKELKLKLKPTHDIAGAQKVMDVHGLDLPRTEGRGESMRQQSQKKLDILGLDGASTEGRDDFMRQQLQKNAEADGLALDQAPRARAPERELAETARAKAKIALSDEPFVLAKARKAAAELRDAVKLAVAAMQKVHDEHGELVKQATLLPAIAEADEAGGAGHKKLHDLRGSIDGKLKATEPSADDVNEARDLLKQFSDDAETHRKAVAERLKVRQATIIREAKTAMDSLTQFGEVEPSMLTEIGTLSGTLDKAVQAPPAVQGIKDAEEKLKTLQEAAQKLAKELGELGKERTALADRAKKAAGVTVSSKAPWHAVASVQIKEADRLAQEKLLARLSPASVNDAGPLVEALWTLATLAEGLRSVMRDRSEIDLAAYKDDATVAEKADLRIVHDRIANSLAAFTEAERVNAAKDVETLRTMAKKLGKKIDEYYSKRIEDEQAWARSDRQFSEFMKKAAIAEIDTANELADYDDLKVEHFDHLDLAREKYLAVIDSDFTRLTALIDRLDVLLAAPVALQIGFDPAKDLDALYDYYVGIDGQKEKGHLQTVCGQGGKAGGHYTYKGKKYKLEHNSHGEKNAGLGHSVTAWTILIDGNIQVVGVGYHNGKVNYNATFPRAGGRQDKCNPSVNLVDTKNP